MNNTIQNQARFTATQMQACIAIIEQLSQSSDLNTIHIGSAVPLDIKTAVYLSELKKHGAGVSTIASDTCDSQIIEFLINKGVSVFASTEPACMLLDANPDIVFDDSAILLNSIRSLEKTPDKLSGLTEHTLTGSAKYKAASNNKSLPAPVVDLNNAYLTKLTDTDYGTGQSSVLAFVDITNLQLGGRKVLVVGYNQTGESVAKHARAFGAQVTVTEPIPIRELKAKLDGHHTLKLNDAANRSDIVFITEARHGEISLDWLSKLPDGANICVVTEDTMFPHSELNASVRSEEVRQHVLQYQMPGGRVLHLIAEGRPLHKAAGQGSPIEVTDLFFALQTAAIGILLKCETNEYLTLPIEVQNQVASIKLQSMQPNI